MKYNSILIIMINTIIFGQLMTHKEEVKKMIQYVFAVMLFHLSNELQKFKHNGILSFTQHGKYCYLV